MINGHDVTYYHELFNHSPISLWEEDFSAVKHYLDDLRLKGVTDIRRYLEERPDVIDECMSKIVVLNVNQKTLDLFRAKTKQELLANLNHVFRDEMRRHFYNELISIWEGQLEFECEGINYSLRDEPIDIFLSLVVLPGFEESYGRVLVSIEDIGVRKRAERALAVSEAHFRGLFEYSPISLWEEDFSGVKKALDELRSETGDDIRLYLIEHPQIVEECMSKIVVLDVNRRTLELFGAKSKEELLDNLGKVFRDEMRNHFRDEMVSLWHGDRAYECEGINYTLSGEAINIHLRWSVMPGSEMTFERVLVSIEDITARKRAEEYLRYLGTHDVMTALYNRAFFEEERARFQNSRLFPISVVIADLNFLKRTNDGLGHEAGDDLLRRAAEVLKAAFREEDVVARIGGDEFAVLLPKSDAAAAEQALQRIRTLMELNNKYYQGPPLSMSLGAATGNSRGELLTAVQREADDNMYREKKEHHKLFPR
jgi:diguanylate cyclase (GGDEF)-like protein